jgi:nucleoside 2-deoxyribosyltransferase
LMKNRVYVCGPMTGVVVSEFVKVRSVISDELRKRGLHPVDPTRAKNYVEADKPLLDSADTDKYIVSRDFNDVKNCDAVLADLRIADRVSIGSMVEFGWADALRIPIVTLHTQDRTDVYDHAFIRHMSMYETRYLDDAVQALVDILA